MINLRLSFYLLFFWSISTFGIVAKEDQHITVKLPSSSLPFKSIEEPGTLIERYKSACKLPFYSSGDPVIMDLATEELKQVLSIVYQKLLGLDPQ